MNFKNMPELKWISGQSNLVLIFRDRTVDAVWTEQSLLGPTVRLMERFARDEEMPAALAERLRTADKTPSRVLVCLPREWVIQRTLFYPAAVQNDLAQMVQFEASRHIPLPEAERRIAYTAVLLPEGKQVGVNLLAARTAEIAALLEPLTAAGIPVDEVTSLSALLVPGETALPVLLLLTGEANIELALFADGLLQDSLLLDRQAVGFGKEALTDAVRRLTVRHRERLGAEGIGKIVSAGSAELPEDFTHGLEAAFGLTVHTLDIPEPLKPAVAGFADRPLLPEALHLSVSEFPASLNLIDRPGRKVTWSRRSMMIAGLCALLAVELLAGWLVRTFSPAVALKIAEREASELKRKAAPVQTVKNQNREMRNELDQLAEMGKTRISVMGMLKTVSDALPDDTYLLSFSYSKGDEITLRGRSKTPDRLPQMIQSLPFVKSIEESDIGEKESEYYGFRISAALRSTSHE
jgi:Tfp pilus assembly protein PilN